MKPQETRAAFIEMRAEGQSYQKIAEALHISKSTCTAWERELSESIAKLKQERLNELYTEYGMTKESRIRRYGDTLAQINEALEAVDLTQVAPEKLLDFKLKYMQALKAEFAGLSAPVNVEDGSPESVLAAFADIYSRVRNGEITDEQASIEAKALASILQAYNAVETKARIDALDAIVSGRGA